jgi:hypothetical protein
MRWAALIQLSTGFLLAAGRAQAEPPQSSAYELSYRAPTTCPDDQAFRADVAKHVHDTSRAAGARVELTIEKLDDGYRGILIASDSSGAQGSRRIDGQTCAEVAHALAFFAGLVIELGGRVESDLPSPAQSSIPPPVPPATSPPPEAPRVRAETRTLPLQLSALALADARGAFALAPRLSGEAGVELAVGAGMASPSLRLLGFAGKSDLDGSAGSATLRFFGGRLELCPVRFGTAQLVVRPCLGSELGLVDARGQVAQQPRSRTTPWVSVEATLRLQWFVTRGFFAELGGGPVFPLVRTHYYFEPDRTLYTAPELSARVAMGLGLLFQ